MAAFEKNRADHIAVYGPDNHMRLTGKHETRRSTSSATAWPTVAHRSACRTASCGTTTGAISKIAVPTRRAIPTRLPRRS